MSSSESIAEMSIAESEDAPMILGAGEERPVAGLDFGTSESESLDEELEKAKDKDYEDLEEEVARSGKKRKTENPLGTRGNAAFFT